MHWRPEVGELTDLDGIRIADGLWLVRASATRSERYRRVDRRLQPELLLVARTDGHPKIKGARRGVRKWLKQTADTPSAVG